MDFWSLLLYYMSIMESDLTFLHGQHAPRCAARVDKHFVGYCSLQYMDRGAIELSYDTRSYRLEGRWFWFCFPGPHIRFHPAGGTRDWDHRHIAFQGPRLDRWQAEGLIAREPQPAWDGCDLPARHARLREQIARQTRWGTLRAINLLEGMLLELAERRGLPDHAEPWLDRVMARLSDPTHAPGELADLADLAGRSLSTLRRQFRQRTGLSLGAYAIQARIHAAGQLLVQTDEPIKTIAQRLGYRDVYFFSRQFARFAGMPPGQFRRSRQG